MRLLQALTLLSSALLFGSCGGGGGSDSPGPPAPQPPGNAPPTVVLNATPRSIAPGEAVSLQWTSSGASDCSARDGWSGTKPLNGQESSGSLDASAIFGLECHGLGGTTTASVSVEVSTTSGGTRFPLHVEDRHLVDAAGKPFLLRGDTAWSLIAQLNRDEVQTYLNDRKARGFNTLLVNLIEHHFANRAPANAYGDEPFARPGDFSTPNAAYFAHADWVLNRAQQMGFVVLLVPAYLGYGGGTEGWYSDLAASSDATLTTYGRYVATRYRALGNVIWIYGGDFDPPQRRVVLSMAAGVAAVDPDAIGSAHNAPETEPGEFWRGEPWLRVDNVYSYDAVGTSSLAAFRRRPEKPFFLMETSYENERGTDGKGVRSTAYAALLNGAAGNVFGNNPIWHFNAPNGPDAQGVSWNTALGGPGSDSMTHLWDLLTALRWWLLEPDPTNKLLTSGAQNGAFAAVAQDHSFAIAYLPSARMIRLDLGLLTGPQVSATWIDPSSGARTAATGSPFGVGQAPSLGTPQQPSNVDGDWVLLLESQVR